MPSVSSRQHPLVAEARAILRGDDEARLLLDGWHLVADAVAAGLAIDVLAIEPARVTPAQTPTVERLRRSSTRVVEVASRVMAALSPVKTPTGVVALAHRPVWPADALLEPPPALVLVAAGVQDPGNVGALIRSAEAGGATGVLLDAESADPFDWKALRAGMGSTLRLPVHRGHAVSTHLTQWQRAGVRLVTTDAIEGVPLDEVDLAGPCAVLMGAEGRGVPAALSRMADLRLRIPMRPPVESLNVAVAAALIVYEARRQRERIR